MIIFCALNKYDTHPAEWIKQITCTLSIPIIIFVYILIEEELTLMGFNGLAMQYVRCTYETKNWTGKYYTQKFSIIHSKQ